MKKPIVISLINHKGGTGKTLSTLNLAEALKNVLAKKMKVNGKILLIDNDPQASLTSFFYNIEEELEPNDTIIALYNHEPFFTKDIILQTSIKDVDLVANMFSCGTKEKALSSLLDGNFRLKDFIKKFCGNYNFILIDNSPFISAFTNNAFIASDAIIIPTIPTRLSIIGIKEILKNIQAVQERVNSELTLLGILINMLDERIKTHQVASELLVRAFGETVFHTSVHHSAALQKAEERKLSIAAHDRTARAYKEYYTLATEILARYNPGIKFNSHRAIHSKFGLSTEENNNG
ncbi:MAG: ParA family protein [Candidatus Cloacimonetes bacterium]|nr:ParA family protein [Candidatus Cloacimonadota bacterium]